MRCWKIGAIAASIGLAAVSPGVAADRSRTPADKAGSSCNGADAGCLDRALAAVEAGHEAAVTSARATLSGGALTGDSLKTALELFEASNKDWRAQRAALCSTYDLYDKALGAPSGSARWGCIVNETLHRTNTLKRLFSSE